MAVQGGINHVTLRVTSLERSATFYRDLLGMGQVGYRPGMQFFSSGQYNHELVLMEDPQLSKSSLQQGGLVHIGFNVENIQALSDLYHKLTEAGYPVSTGIDHVISHSFYTRDPDGYTIELTTDCDKTEWADNTEAFNYDNAIDIQGEKD